MPFNIEEQEDFLKKNSPYKAPDDAQWEAMQQRIKAKTLEATASQPKNKIPLLRTWKITATAASLALILSIGYLIKNKPEKEAPPLSAISNPETQLNAAITGLNETELNWMHQLTENEISEQNEYFEN